MLSNTMKYHMSITETLIITFQELPKAYDDYRILASEHALKHDRYYSVIVVVCYCRYL